MPSCGGEGAADPPEADGGVSLLPHQVPVERPDPVEVLAVHGAVTRELGQVEAGLREQAALIAGRARALERLLGILRVVSEMRVRAAAALHELREDADDAEAVAARADAIALLLRVALGLGGAAALARLARGRHAGASS
jgi:hypothetical protein